MPSSPDFFLINHGSIFTLRALTTRAKNWVTLHLSDDFNGIIEPRYLEPILEGIREEGLTFQ